MSGRGTEGAGGGALALGCVAAAGVSVVLLGLAAFLGFFLLVALNGFSESEAAPILAGFAICVLALVALGSFGASALVLRRHPHRIMASLAFAAALTLAPLVAIAGWYLLANAG
jgi:hypothetical protein